MKRNALFSRVPWLIYDDYTRREEVKNLVALIKGQQAPIVAAGDFNFSNHSHEYKLLAHGSAK
jgi:endonuclease/exonuclease/phosphatase family metal-dependent hydrolase